MSAIIRPVGVNPISAIHPVIAWATPTRARVTLRIKAPVMISKTIPVVRAVWIKHRCRNLKFKEPDCQAKPNATITPIAADSVGVSVARIRYFTIILGGILSGIAGASLSIALLNVFQQNMTSGLGFIAVALVYFGAWRVRGVLVGALLFSMVNSLQLWMQVLNIPIPSELAVMMPYVLTIIVLVVTVSRVRSPAALTKPFDRGG